MSDPAADTAMTSRSAADAPLECVVYRCSAREEMYLYMRTDVTAEVLPEGMLGRLGALQEVMNLSLHPQRRLARVDVLQVLRALRDNGYFLQLPPPPDEAERITDG